MGGPHVPPMVTRHLLHIFKMSLPRERREMSLPSPLLRGLTAMLRGCQQLLAPGVSCRAVVPRVLLPDPA